MEWLKHLTEAIDYIEDHLEGEISYEEAARIACCSVYYFQRVFSYVAGISLSEYIRRRRMTQAAFDIQRTNRRITDIGLKYGYDSPTAFNRAFQRVHNIPPVAARIAGSKLNAYPPIRFSVSISGACPLTYRVTEKKAMRVVGIRIPLVEDMEENQRRVPEFWNSAINKNLLADIIGVSDREPEGILGITAYEGPGQIFYYIAAATGVAAPKGMLEYEIPSARWVIFENEGPFKETVQNAFRQFYTEWLPFSGYEYVGLPDIEIYPICSRSYGHFEVWIAVKT